MPFELIIIQFNGMCVCGLYKLLREGLLPPAYNEVKLNKGQSD